jgi:pimeloyl-ACP methyl ester carboxylesterase
MRKLTRIAATAVAAVAAAAVVVTGGPTGGPAAQGDGRTGGHGRYAEVNGLRMYYEVHGRDRGRPPVVLLHGAFSATGTSWGELVKPLSRTRQVISVELQGHGHTGDVVARPLRIETMAQDTVALLAKIGVRKADLYGYSMGAGVALNVGVTRPDVVNKLVLQSVSINDDGYHPGHLEAMESITPDMLVGSPFHEEYVRLNPRPENFALLVEKVKDMVKHTRAVSPEQMRALPMPVLTIMGDSDIFQLEHAVEMFELTGGGVNGDIAGMPKSRLAILPGTSHVTSVYQREQLVALVPSFLDAA